MKLVVGCLIGRLRHIGVNIDHTHLHPHIYHSIPPTYQIVAPYISVRGVPFYIYEVKKDLSHGQCGWIELCGIWAVW